MTDTPVIIQQKQMEIILQKSSKERFLIGAELIDFGWELMESQIRKSNPEFNEIETKIEIFTKCYSNCFPPEERTRIIQYMKSDY